MIWLCNLLAIDKNHSFESAQMIMIIVHGLLGMVDSLKQKRDFDLEYCDSVCETSTCSYSNCFFKELNNEMPKIMLKSRSNISLQFFNAYIESIKPTFFQNLHMNSLTIVDCEIVDDAPTDLFQHVEFLEKIEINDDNTLGKLFWADPKFTEPLLDKIKTFELSENVPEKCTEDFFMKFTHLIHFVFKEDIDNFDFLENFQRNLKITFQHLSFDIVFKCLKLVNLRKLLKGIVFDNIDNLLIDTRHIRRFRKLKIIIIRECPNVKIDEKILEDLPKLEIEGLPEPLQTKVYNYKPASAWGGPATVVDAYITIIEKSLRLTCVVKGKFPIDVVFVDHTGVESRYPQFIKKPSYKVTKHFTNYSRTMIRNRHRCYANNSYGMSDSMVLNLPEASKKSSSKSCAVVASLAFILWQLFLTCFSRNILDRLSAANSFDAHYYLL
ncbi:hypothetical protein HELRODRAFT_178998 [Helobdella robusta]|uniref:Uncharacterized protein n=1 Tax=Helobdella robusta TaxID=6412 RepID=T1FE11_HELRO|nr:hypothetical protein HELRODRAFT_178998 [Helobdella robusta]ESN95814.1 hypothetical protein HELRODRAFT_178998 [Helobdella robusta]